VSARREKDEGWILMELESGKGRFCEVFTPEYASHTLELMVEAELGLRY